MSKRKYPVGSTIEVTRTQRYKVIGYDDGDYPDMIALGVSKDVQGATCRFAHRFWEPESVNVERVGENGD